MKLTLVLNVEYIAPEEDRDYLVETLNAAAEHLYNEGLLTGEGGTRALEVAECTHIVVAGFPHLSTSQTSTEN